MLGRTLSHYEVKQELSPRRHGRRIRPEWSADGENFYFTLTEFESDVWVMELESSSE